MVINMVEDQVKDKTYCMCLVWTGLSASAMPEIMALPHVGQRKAAVQEYYENGKAPLLAQLSSRGFKLNNNLVGTRVAILEATTEDWKAVQAQLSSLGVIATINQEVAIASDAFGTLT